jgi:hypothetical protein
MKGKKIKLPNRGEKTFASLKIKNIEMIQVLIHLLHKINRRESQFTFVLNIPTLSFENPKKKIKNRNTGTNKIILYKLGLRWVG